MALSLVGGVMPAGAGVGKGAANPVASDRASGGVATMLPDAKTVPIRDDGSSSRRMLHNRQNEVAVFVKIRLEPSNARDMFGGS
jgi:hypothetical protein